MNKISSKMIGLAILCLTSIIICNADATFRFSGVYDDGTEIPVQRSTVVAGAFDSILNIEEVKEIKFRNITNEQMKKIVREFNGRPFNNLKIVDLESNYKITAGIFSKDADAVQEFIRLLERNSFERVKLFGTVLADDEGKEDRITLRLPMIKDQLKNRSDLYEKITTIACAA